MNAVQITHAPAGSAVTVEYSTMSPFSYQNKWLLLQQRDGFFQLYTGDGVFVRVLPATINTSSRPRWSRTLPDVLTFIAGHELSSYNVAAKVFLVLHVFTEYVSIQDGGEAEVSRDGNHRVLVGTQATGVEEVFVYDLAQQTKGKVYLADKPFDGLKLDSKNRVILSRSDGLFILENGGLRQLTTADGHACMAVHQGRDVVLWCNAAENPITLQAYPNGVISVDVETGEQKGLISFPWSDAIDISMPESGDYCYVSTYGGTEKSGRLYQAALDNSEDTMLLDGINHAVQSYEGQPRFSVSRDGSRGVYAAVDPDGITVNTWMVRLTDQPVVVPVKPVTVEYWIDYSQYLDHEFVIKPQKICATCGSTVAGIYERKAG